jgi:hypothetical protein
MTAPFLLIRISVIALLASISFGDPSWRREASAFDSHRPGDGQLADPVGLRAHEVGKLRREA